MKRKTQAIISLTLISTLFLVYLSQSTDSLIVSAQYGAANMYTTNWYIPDGAYPTNEDVIGGQEEQTVSLAFSEISNLMSQQTYTYWDSSWPWWPISQEPVYASIDNFGDQTSPSLVTS